jgi:hypothetical protein
MADPTSGQGAAGMQNTTQAAMDLNDVIVAIEASTKSIAETFKSIDLSNIKTFTQEINGATKEWVDNVKQISSEFRKELETLSLLSQDQQQLQISGLLSNQQRSVQSHYVKEDVKNLEHELQLSESLFESLQRRMKFWGSQLDELAPKTRAAYKTMDQAGRALSNPAAVPGQILNAMPGAGILSFLVMGMQANEKWRSMTEQAVQQFDRIGGGGKKFSGEMQGIIQNLSNDLTGGAQTLVAINQAFAATGVTAKQAWGKEGMTASISGVGRSLAEVSMKFDMLTEQAPGTTANLIGTAYGQMGSSLESATSAVVVYGMAARNAGLDQVGFVNSVVQNAQSLKLYGIQLDSVAEATLRVAKANQEAGMGKAYSLEVGKAGISQVTSGLAGISPGFAAVIGQSVATALNARGNLHSSGEYNKWTDGGSAFGIMMEMRQGFRNAPTDSRGAYMGESIKALSKQALETSGGKLPEAQYFLEKMGFGLEGARTILQLGGKMTGDKPELSKADQKTLADAMKSEADKTSNMDKSLQYLVTAVGQVAIGLLGMILGGIKIMIDALHILVVKAMDPLANVDDLFANLKQDFGVIGQSAHFMAEAGENLKKSGSNLGNSVPFLRLFEERTEEEKAEIKRRSAGRLTPTAEAQISVLKVIEKVVPLSGVFTKPAQMYLNGQREATVDGPAHVMQNRDGTFNATLHVHVKPQAGIRHVNARSMSTHNRSGS